MSNLTECILSGFLQSVFNGAPVTNFNTENECPQTDVVDLPLMSRGLDVGGNSWFLWRKAQATVRHELLRVSGSGIDNGKCLKNAIKFLPKVTRLGFIS